MDPLTGAAIVAAGATAGVMNAVVGAGTLVTFPTLLALGWPPVVANVSNNIGLVAGGVTGSWGYRRELAGQRAMLLRLAPLSVAGAIVGAVLLLQLPADAFEAVVPVLIAVSLVLVVAQPWISRRLAGRSGHETTRGTWATAQAGTFLAGTYGGYFGAAQGVLLVGMLGALLAGGLQRINATKNVLTTLVNLVAAGVFVLIATDEIDWAVVGLIAAGAFAGGLLGASVGRRLPQPVLRAFIVVIGLVAIVRLVTT